MDVHVEDDEGSWRIERRPSSLSGTGPSIYGAGPSATGRLMRSSFTFPSPYHSKLSLQYRPISSTYSRHSQLGYVPLSQTGSGPQNFYHQTPTYYQERRRRRLSHDLTPIRTSQTQWPVRPLRASVPLQTSPHWRELEGEGGGGGGGGGRGKLSVVQSYSGKLQDPDGGIPTRERMVEGAVQRVFTGADALEWFTDNMMGVASIEQAKNVGTQLLRAGLIVNVSGQGDGGFYGSPNALYQFKDNSTPSEEEGAMKENGTQNQSGEEEEKRKGKCLIQ